MTTPSAAHGDLDRVHRARRLRPDDRDRAPSTRPPRTLHRPLRRGPHATHAETLAGLTAEAGGEPYECANAWYIERTVDPIFAADHRRRGAEHRAERRPGARPAHRRQRASSRWPGPCTSRFVELLTERRAARRGDGASAPRRPATPPRWRCLATGVPDGYISPALLGEDLVPDETGLFAAVRDPDPVRLARRDRARRRRPQRRRHPVDVHPRDPGATTRSIYEA